MKLVRMDGGRIGLFVMLPNGPHAVDIANSLGVFPHDPLSNGLLNGALKDGHDWSIIVKHWVHLRWPLKKLQNIALATPDTPRLVLQPLVDATGAASAANPIIAIEVTDIESVEGHDPTGRHAMLRQFALPPRHEAVQKCAPDETVRVIDFPRDPPFLAFKSLAHAAARHESPIASAGLPSSRSRIGVRPANAPPKIAAGIGDIGT
jgi:hypothetical protein